MVRVVKASKGTLDALKTVVEDKLEEFDASNDVKVKAATGDISTMREAVEDKLEELGEVRGADDASEEDFRERYIHSLIGELDTAIHAIEDVTSVVFDDRDSDTLVITVTKDPYGKIFDYYVPYEDLSMRFDSMDKDVKYILDAVNA